VTILGHKVLFCKPGHTIEPPTDADFEELDREEAKQAKIEAAKEKLIAAALKKRGRSRMVALSDAEADIAAMEEEE
jgi:hypothetical protein